MTTPRAKATRMTNPLASPGESGLGRCIAAPREPTIAGSWSGLINLFNSESSVGRGRRVTNM